MSEAGTARGLSPTPAAGEGPNLFGSELALRLCEFSPLGICLSDPAGRCIYANAAYLATTGLTQAQVHGALWSESLQPDDRERVNTRWLHAVRSREPLQTEVRIYRSDGRTVWARLHASTAPSESESGAFLLLWEDITERKCAEAVLQRAEAALFAEKERAQVTLDSIGDAVLVTDLTGNLTFLNLQAESLTGWPREEALGLPLEQVCRLIDGASRDAAPNPAERAIAEDRTVGLAIGCVLLRRDGGELGIEDSAAPIHDRDGAVTGAVIVFRDVVQSRLVSQRMAHLALHDHLTGLANTVLLQERLKQIISLARRHHQKAALLFIDLNSFKEVNDIHGHHFGDQILVAIARRLEVCVRESDTVCRRGGDEFVILLTEITSRRDAARVARSALAAISEPLIINGISVRLSASIGISLYPDHGNQVDALLRCADLAMYEVKAGDPQGGLRFARRTDTLAWPQ
jgi:diguanylate cyclase (GGDEF)-like protein/PAS domain S-box-containing protein